MRRSKYELGGIFWEKRSKYELSDIFWVKYDLGVHCGRAQEGLEDAKERRELPEREFGARRRLTEPTSKSDQGVK